MSTSEGLREFLRYHRQMVIIMVCVCAAVLAGFLICMPAQPAWAGGFVLGAAAQLLKFALIDVATIKKVAANQADAPTAQLKALLFSLFLFGLAVVGVLYWQWSVWAMAVGIFLPRLILLADASIRPNPFASPGDGSTGETAAENGKTAVPASEPGPIETE
ncbi:MAG: hypothetical protein LIP23_09355 [Planctomycetes bacterium]|nr:hypothetical protein [Planctomycetota bacterium]